MIKIDPNMKQEELTALAVQRMKEVFLRADWQESTYVRLRDSILCPSDKKNIYFSGPLYLKDGFVDAQMIARLQAGARMLSVGVGEGHLERLLALGFGIPQEQMSIADNHRFHPKMRASGFPEYSFDMTKEWPKFEERFDYVLFPESLNIATMNYKDEMTVRFNDDVRKVESLFEKGKLNELRNPEADFYINLIEQDVPVVKVRYDIIRRALDILNPKGEVRISSGIKPPQQPAYVQLKLRRDRANVSYPPVKQGNYFFIRLEQAESHQVVL